MSTVIDTPDGIAFYRAAARLAALDAEMRSGQPVKRGQTPYSIIKQVYGFRGNREAVRAQLDEYIQSTLDIRRWSEARGLRAQSIATEAINRAEEEGAGERLQQVADSNVQALFDGAAITEQEGNDACQLIFTEVVRQHAGGK